MLVKPAFRALVLAAFAGIPAALVGCGANDTPSSTGVATTSVNPDDPKSWDDFLKSIDVPLAPREDLGTERASGKRGAFLIYPVGEVRKVGLRKFRIDVTSDFDAKGDLRFSKGTKTLFETAFDPASLTKESFVAQLPSAVLETLAAGDTVKWGLYFTDKKVKDVVATFKVIDKSAATKDIAKKIDGNKSLASTPTIRELARAEILMNYSLYSEVVEVLSDVAASDKTLQAPYLPLANALRRLKLKDSPLFQEASVRATSQTPRGRGLAGGPGSGPEQNGPTSGDGKGNTVEAAKAGPTPSGARAGNTTSGLRMGGSVPPGLRYVAPNPANSSVDPATLPPQGQEAWQAYVQAREVMRHRAEQDRIRAEHMKNLAEQTAKQAAEANAALATAQQTVKDLEKQLADAAQALQGNPNDPALQQQVADLQQQLAAAHENLLKLQQAAADAQLKAEKAAMAAEAAAKQAEQSAAAATGTGSPDVKPTAGPLPLPPPDTTSQPTKLTFEQAVQNLTKAYEGVVSAQKAVQDALAAVSAADEKLAAATTPEEQAAAQAAHDAAWQAYQDALNAEAAAVAAAEQAETQMKKAAK